LIAVVNTQEGGDAGHTRRQKNKQVSEDGEGGSRFVSLLAQTGIAAKKVVDKAVHGMIGSPTSRS